MDLAIAIGGVRRVFNHKMLLYYVRKPCNVDRIVRVQSPRKRKNRYRKDGEFIMQEKQFKVDMLKTK